MSEFCLNAALENKKVVSPRAQQLATKKKMEMCYELGWKRNWTENC